MANEEQTLRQQIDTTVVDARNETISQAAGAYAFGHRVVLTGVGSVLLGIDQVQSLFQHAVARGETAEADMEHMLTGMRQRVTDAAGAVRSNAAVRSTAAVSSRVASLLNKLPGVSISYQAPADVEVAAQPEAHL